MTMGGGYLETTPLMKNDYSPPSPVTINQHKPSAHRETLSDD